MKSFAALSMICFLFSVACDQTEGSATGPATTTNTTPTTAIPPSGANMRVWSLSKPMTGQTPNMEGAKKLYEGGVEALKSALAAGLAPPGFYACSPYTYLVEHGRVRYNTVYRPYWPNSSVVYRYDCFEFDLDAGPTPYVFVDFTDPNGNCGSACGAYHMFDVSASLYGGGFVFGCLNRPGLDVPNVCMSFQISGGRNQVAHAYQWDQDPSWTFDFLWPQYLYAQRW